MRADLRLSAGGTIQMVVGDRQPVMAYQVANLGPDTATGVKATFEFPTGLSPAPDPGSCTQTDTGYACTVDLDDRFPGQAPRSGYVFQADAPGSYQVRISVSADQLDPDLSNNVATATVVVSPSVDVSVKVTDSADPSRPGRPITYTATVTNNGPSPSPDVTLTDAWQTTIRGGVKVLSVRTSQGACSPNVGTGRTCRLGAIAAGGSASVTISLKPRGKGTVTDTASVNTADYDRDRTNNTDTETTTVGNAKAK